MSNPCIFSADRKHRYVLRHSWPALLVPAKTCMWIGLNPSTADENKLDPTLTRIRDFSDRFGCSEFIMTNLFAFRATKPKNMMDAADPVGIDNDFWLLDCAKHADLIIAAWGAHGKLLARDEAVKNLLKGRIIHCLSKTKEGHPAHPLYLKSTTELIRFA